MPIKSTELQMNIDKNQKIEVSPSKNRRRFIFAGSTIGSLGLSGCASLDLSSPFDFIDGAGSIFGSNFGGEARSREIFRHIDAGSPVPITSIAEEELRKQKRLLRKYKIACEKFEAKTNKESNLPFEEVVSIFGETFAELARYGLMSAAEKDKAALYNSKKKKLHKSQLNGSIFEIPSGHMLTYDQQGFCMDPSLPAPTKGDAYTLRPVSDRVPPQLNQLYRALAQTRQQNIKGSKQGLTWTLMGAGQTSGWGSNVNKETLQEFERIVPGGAKAFTDYHNSQVLIQGAIGAIFKATGLDKHISAQDLMNPASRERAVNAQMDKLIAAGQNSNTGKGIGYSMLAEGIASRVTGAATLKPKIQIANTSKDIFSFDLLNWFAKPLASKQSVSSSTDLSGISDRTFQIYSGNRAKDEGIFNSGDQGSYGNNKGSSRNDSNGSTPGSLESAVGSDGDIFVKTLFSDVAKVVANRGIDGLNRKSDVVSNRIQKAIDQTANQVDLPKGSNRLALKAMGGAITLVPVIGNVLSAYEAFTGKDWLTGSQLTIGERALSLLGTVPGGNVLKGMAAIVKIPAATKIFNIVVGSGIPKFIENTSTLREVAGFLLTDTARNVAGYAGFESIKDIANQSKKTSEIYALSLPDLPWSEPYRNLLKMLD